MAPTKTTAARPRRMGASPRRWARPNNQAAKAASTPAPSALARPIGPVCWASTQISQATAAYIGKARTWRRVSIQAPGFGIRRSRAGAKDRATNGAARPRPRAAKISSETTALWVSA